MKNEDIQKILCDVRSIVDDLSKEKLRQLMEFLFAGQQHRCVFADSVDLVKYTKSHLTSLIKYDNLLELFDKQQIKSLYRLLADYGIYPICPLCGEPIKMRSAKHNVKFSWDHIVPKSLGGPDSLDNLQPTHKICNNLKGNDILYHAHYNIKVVFDIEVDVDVSEASKQYKKKDLHKKTYWRQNIRGRRR